MQIILLERVDNLGTIGDEVKVKRGYARNFLLPQGKALIANERNRKRFERERADIEARNEKARTDAASTGEKIDGASFVLLRQAGDTGVLYGSVAARDIVDAAKAEGYAVERRHVILNQPIKTIGLHEIAVRLHPEVTVTVTANVARSKDEAERQAAGENVIETQRAEAVADRTAQAAEIAEANAEAAAERTPDEE